LKLAAQVFVISSQNASKCSFCAYLLFFLQKEYVITFGWCARQAAVAVLWLGVHSAFSRARLSVALQNN
jgi:hypothetical protein